MRPSFLAHIGNGLLILLALYFCAKYYEQFDMQNTAIIIILLSIAIGIHGILHHYEELYYNFNPLENKWNN